MANGNFGGGDGSELKPFLVEDVQDLRAVEEKNNEVICYYEQTKNIDLGGIEWTPICGRNGSLPFEGNYNGGRFEISNMNISLDIGSLGLFDTVRGIIDSVVIRDSKVSGKARYLGILAGQISSNDVSNCSIIDCSLNGSSTNYSGYVGGMAGDAFRTNFYKCEIIGVSAVGDNVVGAFCGDPAHSNFVDCCVTGNVVLNPQTVENAIRRTGAFGNTYISHAVFKNCYSDVSISGISINVSYGDKWSLGMDWSFAYDGCSMTSCYGNIDDIINFQWQSDVWYNENTFIRGTDGEIYNCILIQGTKDYEYWEDDWDITGPPEWYPSPMYRAKPITGELYADYWELVIGSTNHKEARTKENMLVKENYVDWDFIDTWKIKEGELPRLNFPLKRSLVTCKRVPLTNYRG